MSLDQETLAMLNTNRQERINNLSISEVKGWDIDFNYLSKQEQKEFMKIVQKYFGNTVSNNMVYGHIKILTECPT